LNSASSRENFIAETLRYVKRSCRFTCHPRVYSRIEFIEFTEFTEAVSDNTDGIIKHKLSPYRPNAHYLNYNFLFGFRFQYLMNMRLKVVQLIQHCGKLFHLSVTLFPNTNFLISNLLHFFVQFLRMASSINIIMFKIYICVNSIAPFINLKTSIKSPLTLRISKLFNPNVLIFLHSANSPYQ